MVGDDVGAEGGSAPTPTQDGEGLAATTPRTDRLEVLEEVAHVAARPVETERVRVATHTETIADVARAELHGETVDVERVAVGMPVTGPLPEVRTEGDVTIVPVLEEVLVVEKRLMLKEELRIKRRPTVEPVAVPVTLRRQTATVERLQPDDVAPKNAGRSPA